MIAERCACSSASQSWTITATEVSSTQFNSDGTIYTIASGLAAGTRSFNFSYGVLPPGTYTLRIANSGASATQTFIINDPPRLRVTSPDHTGPDHTSPDHTWRYVVSTAQLVPETWELDGDDAAETLRRVRFKPLLADSITRFRAADGMSHARSLAFATILTIIPGIIEVPPVSTTPDDNTSS